MYRPTAKRARRPCPLLCHSGTQTYGSGSPMAPRSRRRVPRRLSRFAAQYRRTTPLARRAASARLSAVGSVQAVPPDDGAEDRNEPPPSAASGYRANRQPGERPEPKPERSIGACVPLSIADPRNQEDEARRPRHRIPSRLSHWALLWRGTRWSVPLRPYTHSAVAFIITSGRRNDPVSVEAQGSGTQVPVGPDRPGQTA